MADMILTARQITRFWKYAEKVANGCWNWKGYFNKGGYAVQKLGVHHVGAYRISYVLHKGQIPENYEIDHLCRNHACVNPEHLEAVTHRENVVRGIGATAINSRKTHCPRGHPLVKGNLVPLLLNKYNRRSCLICKNENEKLRKRRIRAEIRSRVK